jgi:hypothetical protein
LKVITSALRSGSRDASDDLACRLDSATGPAASGTGSGASPAGAGRPPRILAISLAENLGCERVLSTFKAHGAECAALVPPDFICRRSSAMQRYFPLPPLRNMWLLALWVRRCLKRVTVEWRPDLVLPLDDVTAWLLRGLAIRPGAPPNMRALLLRSLGPPKGYAAALTRGALMDLAEQLGIDKPRHHAVDNVPAALAAAEQWGYPVVIKTDHTCGGAGVKLLRDRDELVRQLELVVHPGPARRATMLLKSILQCQAGFLRGAGNGALLQSFRTGIPAFRTVAAWNGRVLDGVSFAAVQVHPAPTGASSVVRPINCAAMDHAAAAICAALGTCGMVSFDFILDEATGRAALIEMNPRPVGSCHLGATFGHDLCAALVAELTGLPPKQAPAASRPSMVALFPKEMERDPDSPYLRSADVLHDVPLEDPALLDAYRKRSRVGVLQKSADRVL